MVRIRKLEHIGPKCIVRSVSYLENGASHGECPKPMKKQPLKNPCSKMPMAPPWVSFWQRNLTTEESSAEAAVSGRRGVLLKMPRVIKEMRLIV